MIKNTNEISNEETLLQLDYIDKCKNIISKLSCEAGRELTFCVTTFGCQMNARDSEKLCGILKEIGYVQTDSEEADFVIYNTCTVRENANNKVYGRLGVLHSYKKHNPYMKIALCGCMMQEPSVIEKLKESYTFVDLIFGTHNIYKFAELFYTMLINDSGTIIDIWKDTDKIVEDLPISRKYKFKSGINIMFGCNNFCSYCIVPYVRGRERSRTSDDIVREIKDLVDDGVVEVMLLGQNVNSYGKGLSEDITFAGLLDRIAQIDGLRRIRFMTSHPKDLSDDLIDVMSKHDNICNHIHLPLQSGSTKLLADMNRHYTKEDYLLLVDKIRSAIPNCAITTDLIVGYPGETEEDFMDTLDVVNQVGFDSAFTFIYSKRTGTPAALRDDQIPEDVIKDRFDRLLAKVQEDGRNRAKSYEGMTLPVLVEEINRQDSSLVSGRLENNSVVHFPGDASLIGNVVDVHLNECKGFYYYGEMING